MVSLEEQARQLYPEADVIKCGKKIEEFFEIHLKSKDKNHSNSFKARRVTIFGTSGKQVSIPHITFEIDNVLMRLRLFEEINKIKVQK